MINVAIVDDEFQSSEKLKNCLDLFENEYGTHFNVSYFKNGSEFLFHYTSQTDIVFMDVDMPGMDGFTTAQKLRELDKSVIIIFVTFLSKYAIRGYEVDAMDYILKPPVYSSFKLKIFKAVQLIKNKETQLVTLPLSDGPVRVDMTRITYVDIDKHDITYHTDDGDYRAYGTMKQAEKLLNGGSFVRCNSCYLVNLRCVTRIEGNDVLLGKVKLSISRPRKAEFISDFHDYIMGKQHHGEA